TAYPAGQWYFNPYCWQVLFVFGAWCAMGGARRSGKLINSPITLWFCFAYLAFALVMTMAGRFPALGGMMPEWLFSAFNPNDKTNLAPYR
ncbi:OpgC domain-containing protein, partial [Pseudomonas aeruginosa]